MLFRVGRPYWEVFLGTRSPDSFHRFDLLLVHYIHHSLRRETSCARLDGVLLLGSHHYRLYSLFLTMSADPPIGNSAYGAA